MGIPHRTMHTAMKVVNNTDIDKIIKCEMNKYYFVQNLNSYAQLVSSAFALFSWTWTLCCGAMRTEMCQ